MRFDLTNSVSALNVDVRSSVGVIPEGSEVRLFPSPDATTAPNPSPQLPPYTPEPDGDYVNDQWHFAFLGNIAKIWEEYSGAGVHVGIYDDGLQSSHPDLESNYDPTLEVRVGGEIVHPDDDATFGGNPHGTAVAGLIGAANNGFGTTGVAWGATLTGVAVLSRGPADMNINFAGFLEAVDQSEKFDVINHSWGRYPGFWQTGGVLDNDAALIAEWLEALDDGRDGLGTIQVKAAGNHNMNASGDGANASRATIIVGAYDDDGDAAYYSSFGVNLLVSAPSSGAENNRGIVTTDLLGTFNGYDIVNAQGEFVEGDYTNAFGGTSAATPIVTGVIALMLDANDSLGWRDVQNILAYSAHEVGSGVGGERRADEDHDWRYNAADNWNGGGLHYSEDYGFGSVNAYNAVRMAEVWSLFQAPQSSANETSFSSTATDIAIEDQKNTEIRFTFDGSEFDVENVGVSLSLRHSSHTVDVSFTLNGFAFIDPLIVDTYLSDLKIILVSPDGTEMTLADFSRDQAVEDASAGWFSDFNAQGFRGENGIGTWTLRIVDAWVGDDGFVNSAKITLHGRDGAQVNLQDDVYHYTDEVFTTLARDGSRMDLDDAGGSDWLNMAAMTGNLIVKLGNGATSTSNGVAFLKISETADIENAVTGDGDDEIIGTDSANKIFGMRGNDTLDGGGGDDLLAGGAGNDRLTGGAGADVFLFDRALNATANIDIITDFSHIDDSIWLDVSIFDGLALGTLSFDMFYVYGSGALSALDRILYNATTGELFFDADGWGDIAAIHFATLQGAPSDLSFDDFVVVDQTLSPIVTVIDREATDAPTVAYTDVDEILGDDTTIFGSDGNDDIRTKDGNDQIFGMDGIDTIVAGAGNDYIDGGGDIDLIMAGEGDDIVVGGGSAERYGDTIYGEGGNDILTGSEQPNNESWRYLGARGDVIFGGDGNDKIFGLSGDDILDGGEGDDVIFGGGGADIITGGAGDDRLHGGAGLGNLISGGSGIDTAVFNGKVEDYRLFFFSADFNTNTDLWLERVGAAGDDREFTAIRWQDVEYLEFSNGTIALDRPVIVSDGNNPFGELTDIVVNVAGYEIGVQIDYAKSVHVVDSGAENGGEDRLQAAYLGHVEGDITIQSDAISSVYLQAAGKSYWDENFQFVYEAYQGTAELLASAGERTLELMFSLVDLGSSGKLIDRTASAVSISSDLSFFHQLNGAAADDFNLRFDTAQSIRFKDSGDMSIKWFIPNVTKIEMYFEQFEEVTHLTRGGNQGFLRIETALDDAEFATAGSSAEFQFLADAVDSATGLSSGGMESVRFGNLGTVNSSNDGTTGDDALMNSGLGLRGTIRLGTGNDEARILGSGAFQGGTVDAGTGVADGVIESDVLRMTFAVADAIEDISESIAGFEVLQLDITSIADQIADVSKFDNLARVDIAGAEAGAGINTVANLVAGATVTLRSIGSDYLLRNGSGQIYSDYETYGNDFGTVQLDLKQSGGEIALSFVGLETDGFDTGTINVRNAATVHIVTDAKDMDVTSADFSLPVWEPTNPFQQILDLDETTELTLAGETGWDLTVAGTDIGKVTSLDASGVMGTGAVGAVKVIAQTNEAVTFTGGMGDDEFTGGLGNDTLAGGAGGNDILDGSEGIDTAVFAGLSLDYSVTDNGDGSFVVASLDGSSSDTLRNIELLRFENGLYNINFELLEAPTDILPDDASVAENSAAGTVVAELSALDPNTGETFTFTLVDDAEGRFAIVGSELVVADSAGLDYESATEHTVTVKVTDSAGNTLVQTITITVTDVAENSAPTDIAPETASIAENSANGTVVAAFETEDADSGDTFTYTLASNASGRFAISGNKLVVANGSKLDYEASASHQVVVRATDAGGLWVEKTITVAVTDVNEKASVTLANKLASIKETASTASRTKVADIVVTDDALGRNALSLVGRDRALFEIVGMALYLKAGAALDASKLASLEVAVAVDDAAIPGTPDATSATYKLAVADVAGLKMVHGTSASQTLTGSSGSDWFDGHGGEDTFKGGRGDDTYLVDSSGDTVIEGKNEGTDTVRASVTHTLAANVENLVLTGSSSIHGSGNGLDNVITGNGGNNKIWGYDGNDLLRGGAGNDGIDGGAGNDRLYGEAGNDTLKGGSGNDHLDGGAGMDALWGGSGKDVFDFDFTSDSAVGSARDVIYDFERGKDRIDLANIDANTGRGGDQAFTWLGDKAFTGKAGELHFLDKGAEVIVQGDVNGDKIADFDILVKVGSLSHSDFVL